ncbi:MAG: hypothetical protein ACREXU_18465 [Gammaproteobacteria bacterium]
MVVWACVPVAEPAERDAPWLPVVQRHPEDDVEAALFDAFAPAALGAQPTGLEAFVP